MTRIDRDGDGRIDMDTDETTAQLKRVRAAGEALDAAWPGARGRIEAPGLVGGGPMGAAFLSLYSGPKQSVVDAMGQLTGAYQQLADNGDQAVQAYLAADAAAAGQFLR
ncbi:hypothetical protein [Amycolatopsis samaneae]|uniref:Excreted virulence factor EspC, type VII ESX diderm n=1 Tax=Amycolatopsis samaneae TaxID=664691 RepID=A0ABW5GUF1_9PSEU